MVTFDPAEKAKGRLRALGDKGDLFDGMIRAIVMAFLFPNGIRA
jgi:hypothetical protein